MKIRKLTMIITAVCILLLSAALLCIGASAETAVWDGKTGDIGWYVTNTSASEFTIDSAEELYGLSVLVYSVDPKATANVKGDKNVYYDENYKIIFDPEQITSATKYVAATKFAGKTIKLGADIDIGSHAFVPIGSTGSFQGNFNGQSYKISNLYVDTEAAMHRAYANSQYYYGLFAYIAGNAKVSNVTLENVVFDINLPKTATRLYVGGLVGAVQNDKSCIVSCKVNGLKINFNHEDGCASLQAMIGAAVGRLGSSVTQSAVIKDYQFNDINNSKICTVSEQALYGGLQSASVVANFSDSFVSHKHSDGVLIKSNGKYDLICPTCEATLRAEAATLPIVYVSDKGKGENGFSSGDAISDLARAFDILRLVGGEIRVVDRITIKGNYYNATSDKKAFRETTHEKKITLTSASGTGGQIYFGTSVPHWYANGELEFTNMSITGAGGSLLCARHNRLTMGEGLSMSFASGGLWVVGGCQQGAESLCDSTDTHLIFKSGTYYNIIGGMRSYSSQLPHAEGHGSGTHYVDILGDITVSDYFTAANTYLPAQNAFIMLDGNVSAKGYFYFAGVNTTNATIQNVTLLAKSGSISCKGLGNAGTFPGGNTRVFGSANVYYSNVNDAASLIDIFYGLDGKYIKGRFSDYCIDAYGKHDFTDGMCDRCGRSPVLLGDADGDRLITNSDILVYLRYLSGWTVDRDSEAMDIDSSGSVGNRDVMAIIMFLACRGGNIAGFDISDIHSISQLNIENDEIDSHAGLESYSNLELNAREYVSLTGDKIGGMSVPFYPRIRRMENGKYIMVYQANRISYHIYYAISDDGINWTFQKRLFGNMAYPFDFPDEMVFMTPDLCVLDDGTIIAVCAFRSKTAYEEKVEGNGIAIRTSKDNGQSWSDVKIIYTGTAWEPYIMQTSSGEVQVYFTQTGHLLNIHGWNDDIRSSCVGLMRSNDRGNTWTGGIPSAYTAQIVMQQYRCTLGYDIMSGQMPAAIELHNGTIALIAETMDAKGGYKISASYTNDNWMNTLAFNEEGPSDYVKNFESAGGPYIAQFRSGETVLSIHNSGMRILMGDSNARNFSGSFSPYPGHIGLWASLFVDSSHSIMGTIVNILDGSFTEHSKSALDVGRFYLNHAIFSKEANIVLDSRTEDWNNNTSALFIGSESQAQMSIRFAYDDDRLYILIERLDDVLASGDAESIYIASSHNTYYTLNFTNEGLSDVKYFNSLWTTTVSSSNIQWNMKLYDGSGNTAGKQKGKILELSLPLSMCEVTDDGCVLINAVLINQDEGETVITDTFTNVTVEDMKTWHRIYK